MDRQNMTGNHIILQCGGVWVLLAHLQRGSVAITERQPVSRGELLGRVGNTGNTGEPHLHIHAQRPGTAEAPISGDPLHVVLDGRYPVRNARILK
jgi:murein DD-endopeptidase MepM/ murein hydrolase activator NlpD